MKWIFLLCFLITNQLWAQKIIWQENKKLTWENFKSKVNTHRNTNVLAYTNCGWEYSVITSSDPKIPVEITIETIFNEDKSWRDAKRVNDYVLVHEQKHFDIAEIYARKLRKEVSEKVITTGDFKKYFQPIYNKITNEYKSFQMTYDRDTQHGINEAKQAEYNQKIAEELENLNHYKAS